MSRPLSAALRRSEQIGGLLWLFFYWVLEAELLRRLLPPLGFSSSAAVNCVYFFLNFIAVSVIFRRFLADSIQPITAAPLRLVRGVLLGFLLYECAEVILTLLSASLAGADYVTPNDTSIQAIAQEDYAVMWAGAVLLAPLAEETLLRGLVFGSIREKNRAAAYLVTALLFAAMHMVGYLSGMSASELILDLLIYALPSMALCAAYECADTIWAPIILHMIINFIGMSAMNT